jgi:chromatin segregation and condensation protein Rec8/ScpA/Scc1 (kleisin family)
MSESKAKGLFVEEERVDSSEPDAGPAWDGERLPAVAEQPVAAEEAPGSPMRDLPVATELPTATEVAPRRPARDLPAMLQRIEYLLGELHRTLDATLRVQQRREFSIARLLGSILQALMCGLTLWALSDWAFGEPHEGLITKLAFAAVLQLAALSAFTLGREVD